MVIAYDMRESSPELAGAYAEGVTSAGLDVVMAGLGSTDLLYFASGRLNLPGAMFTASHNPARYNGIKMCLAGAVPISLETGLAQVRDEAQALLDGAAPAVADRRGTVTEQNLLADYADYLRSLVDLSEIRPLHVVVDAGNGMAGYTVPAVFDGLPLRVEELYFELDGSFPNHEANPLEPANLVDLQQEVRRTGADIGLAFDGDADRCFVIDEKGDPVSPSAVTALVASRELRRHPGATILYNLISSRAVPEIVREAGGVPIRTRVGHSFIKAEMAATNAVFGGEHSAHYYFADFFKADTGMLAAMHVLAALGGQDLPLSEFAAEYERYADSGEINSTVADAKAKLGEIRAWAGRNGRRDRRTRRAHGLAAGRAVVQRALQQHRAAAAAERRGAGRGRDDVAARRDPGPDPHLKRLVDPPTIAWPAPPQIPRERRHTHVRSTGPTDSAGPGRRAAGGAGLPGRAPCPAHPRLPRVTRRRPR